jgi:EAL domain-containing protein (putative c-di-GMP-specific phosphodiesterase class I)
MAGESSETATSPPPGAAGELRAALGHEELVLHYQPIVALDDGRLTGFEALLRWDHPVLGLLGPLEFLPLAEGTELMVAIGGWVIREAARQLGAWRDQLPEHPITMSVNVSAAQLVGTGLVDDVRAALEANQLDPSSFVLEITESGLMEDVGHAADVFRQLKMLGVNLAVDDFGTGYSSLASLRRFHVDFLKIDRAFIAQVDQGGEDTLVVKAVLELGHALGMTVVAEGVETAAQAEELRRLGCELAQGFRWSVPCRPAEAVSLASGWTRDEATAPVVSAVVADHESAVLTTTELLSLLTHELATPLTVVKGQCERLADVIDEVPRLSGIVDALIRNAERIESLVSSLTDAQQLESGTLALRSTPFDMVELASDAAGLAVNADRTVRVVADGPVVVEADGRRVEQILVNLLSNADKFSPAGAPVEVAVTAHDEQVVVVVADEGPGVPLDRVGDIFRKFGRVDRSKRGLGLGLFVSRRLARAHGGELAFRRRLPVGSEFVLTLPRRSPG